MDDRPSENFNLRSLWPAAAAAVLAVGLVALLYPVAPMVRLSNLALEDSGFPNVYIMQSKTEPGTGFLVDRRDSTIRRDDEDQPGRKWDLHHFPSRPLIPGSTPPVTWLAQSKRKGKGTIFFVPVYSVDDWTYPFFYRFVRKRNPDLDLPKLGWTQLYVNRIYQGLYLRMALPFDLRKKDGGSGILRQLLIVDGSRLSQVNTRFSDARGVYVDSVAGGFFPDLVEPSPELAWLARRRPTESVTFVMDNREPFALSLLPLPLSIADLFYQRHGTPPISFDDGRYERWTQAAWNSVRDDGIFTTAESEEMQAEFEAYATAFRTAVLMDGQLHRSTAQLRRVLPDRQLAANGLDLELGNL